MQNKEGQGFLTIAFNSDDVDYVRLAYLQALNVKATQTDAKYAVIVNTTVEQVPEEYTKVFDYIIPFPPGYHAFSAEPYVLDYTPFKETIKLESDLLFTRSIDHWWTTFRLKDVCLSYQAKDFRGSTSKIRKYRELFDDNNLPDVYNGLMYFRFSRTAHDFFQTAKNISNEWASVKTHLQKCVEDIPSTDLLYALTSLTFGEDAVTIPSTDFLNFVHMKSGFNGWSDTRSWIDTVMNERNGDIIRVNNINQYNPVHYYDKSYATDELIEYYEQRVFG